MQPLADLRSHILWDELTAKINEYLRSVTVGMLVERHRALSGRVPLTFV